MTEQTQALSELLARAQSGDGDAFGELTGPFRRELHVHCYRILGSVHDAEDVLQETLLAAWRGIGGFEGRASLRFWLYRIATNRCLNALRGSGHKVAQSGQQGGAAAGQAPAMPAPATENEPTWLEPYPDTLLAELPDSSPGPEARYEERESISLAFVTALQHLPGRQRATLVLRDVLGYRAAEAADLLGWSLDSVNSSLRRGRAVLAALVPAGGFSQVPLPGSATEREMLARFTVAFEGGDIDALVAMLTDDTWLTMPPWPQAFRGRAAAALLLSVLVFRDGTRKFTLVPTRANGQPAFGCYAWDAQDPVPRGQGLIVLTLARDHISGVARFLDNGLQSWFGLPEKLPRTSPPMQPTHHEGMDLPRSASSSSCGSVANEDKTVDMAHACGQHEKKFVGREPELAVLRDAWDSACRGSGRVVSIEGEPGIGKTELVEEFLAGVSGRVVRVHAIADDPPVPWGTLSEVAAQSDAVRTSERAWELSPQDLPAAVHDMLAGYLRSGERLVIFVDDAQRADRQSLAALTDLGWRFRSERVLLLVAYQTQHRLPLLSRAGPRSRQDWRRLLESKHAVLLPLEGLPPEDVLRLAVASGRHGLSVRDAARLQQATGGNPDYLLDLFPLLSSNPIVIDEGPLPLPANRGAGIMSRFAACGPETRQMLCAGAVLGQRFSVAKMRDVAGVQEPWTHIWEALDHGLVEVVPGTHNRELRFPGRVVAEAVYWAMSERERAEWHRRCARLGGPEALRHRIAAADGVDEALAADLCRAAQERMRIRDLGAAAYYLQRAMDCTERGGPRTALLLRAVEALLTVGKLSAAMEYAGELEQALASPWRDYVLGYLLTLAGQTGPGTLLLRGALAALDRGDSLPEGTPADLRARIAAQLGVLGSVRLSYEQTLADGSAAVAAGSDDAAVRGLALVAKTLGMALAGDGEQALALLADAGEPGSASGIEGLAVRGVIRLWTDDLDGAAGDLHAVFRRCARGTALRTSQAIAYLGEVEYRRGHLRDAAHFAGLAVDNATDNDRRWGRPILHALAVYPHAALAHWEQAIQHAAQADALARQIGEPAFLAYAASSRAAIAQARGDAADLLSAAEVIETVYDSREPGTHLFGPVRADALAQLGHSEEAAESLRRFLGEPGASTRKSARMAAARVAAEISIARGDHAQAARACERARALAAEIGLPLEAARADLTEARSLHLGGKHAAAEHALRAAHQGFTALGAIAYAQLAERRAANWDMRVDDVLAVLTSRERQICVLAGKDLTSAAIARKLSIDVKTVESHRTSAYRKLSLRSLTELKRLLAGHLREMI